MNRKEKVTLIGQVRDLQGRTANPWSVLTVLWIWNGPMTKKLLSELLDSSENTISRIVNRLEMEDRIVRLDYRHWALPNGQLPLPGFETLRIPVAPHKQIPSVSPVAPHSSTQAGRQAVCSDEAEICTQQPGVNAQDDAVRVLDPHDRPPPPETSNSGFETSKFEVSPTTTTTVSKEEKEKVVVGSRVGAETSKFEVSAELAAAFREAGIGRNAWRELAQRPYVTPDYVRAHTAARRADPNPRRRTVGLQIIKMLDGDRAPDVCAACGGLDGAHDAGCPQGRYPGASVSGDLGCPECGGDGLPCRECGLCRNCCSCEPPRVLGLCPYCEHPVKENDHTACPGCFTRFSQMPPLIPLPDAE